MCNAHCPSKPCRSYLNSSISFGPEFRSEGIKSQAGAHLLSFSNFKRLRALL